MLIAGATGSGKGSVIWALVRAMLPAIAAGLVQVWALDPKLMELAFGRALFHRYAATPTAIVELLEAAVADMQARAAQFGGPDPHLTPSAEFPFVVVLVDELAFLTAYQPDRKLRKRAEAALATLTTQGRAVGFCVVAALQDPRKDVLSIRNLFPTGSRCGWMSPTRWTWCSATAPATAARWPTRSPRYPRRAPGSATSGWRPPPTRCGSAPRTSPTTTSAPWPRPSATCPAVA